MIYSVQIIRTYISIHAPREGGDHIPSPPASESYISIHAPREGGDLFALDYAFDL